MLAVRKARRWESPLFWAGCTLTLVRVRARFRVSGEVGHREVLGHESLPWVARQVGAYVVVEPAEHHLLWQYLGEGRHLGRCRGDMGEAQGG